MATAFIDDTSDQFTRKRTSSMTNPRVTIGIPTHNRSSLLRETLKSVLEQSLPEIEVFVLDNASTDDTPKVVASLRDQRLHYIRHETDIGAAENLSMAFHVGTAPFIMVLPDDDLMRPGNLARKVPILEARPDIDIVHSANEFIHIGPHRESLIETYYGGGRADGIETADAVVRRLLTATPPYWINFPTAVIRRSIVARDARFDPADGRADDLGLALRLIRRANRVAYVADPFVAIRKHPEAVNVKLGITEFDSGTYRATLRWLQDRNDVKRRFLMQHGGTFEDLDDIRAGVRRASRFESVWIVRRKMEAANSAAAKWRVIAEAVRREPSLLPSRELAQILADLMAPSSRRRISKGLRALTGRSAAATPAESFGVAPVAGAQASRRGSASQEQMSDEGPHLRGYMEKDDGRGIA
jgi:glycosyltransferase involved in cell wall biosynthesis